MVYKKRTSESSKEQRAYYLSFALDLSQHLSATNNITWYQTMGDAKMLPNYLTTPLYILKLLKRWEYQTILPVS